MTNTYKLKSGKVISEGQTITAEELTVAEFADLKRNSYGSCHSNERAHRFPIHMLEPSDFPITVTDLPAPEPEAPLTLEGIMEGLRNGKKYSLTKEGFKDTVLQGFPTLAKEKWASHALANGWAVREVV